MSGQAIHEPTGTGGDSCSLLVSLPLLVPYGVVVKQDTSASAAYSFPAQFPSARALLSRSLDTCDMFVGQLQVDLVSFSCKKSQVAQVASVFNRMARKKLHQLFDRPIYIRCGGLRQRSISATGLGVGGGGTHDVFIGGGQQRVYFTAVDVLTKDDREKFWQIEGFVEAYVEKLKELKLLNAKSVARTPDLFVVVRRFLSDPLPHPLAHYNQFACDGVQLSEVRLVFSKGTSQCPVKHIKIDPRFKHFEVSCRPIVCDSDGRPARHEFASALVPPVFPSASAAASYLEAWVAEDERELRAFLESEHHSADLIDSHGEDTAESTVESSSVYSPGIRSIPDQPDSPTGEESPVGVTNTRGRRRTQGSSATGSGSTKEEAVEHSSAATTATTTG